MITRRLFRSGVSPYRRGGTGDQLVEVEIAAAVGSLHDEIDVQQTAPVENAGRRLRSTTQRGVPRVQRTVTLQLGRRRRRTVHAYRSKSARAIGTVFGGSRSTVKSAAR
jgi:hypothetical protein